MKTLMRTVTIIFLLAALATTSSSALAQDDETQPLDDKFVGALVVMAVNHNLMEGENEVRDLKALHSFVTDYYNDRIAADPNSTAAQWLGLQKKLLTSKLEEKINLQFGRTMIQTMLTLFTDADMMDMTQVRQVVSGSDDPPADYFNTMNANILTSAPATINALLDIDIITANPSIAPMIIANSPLSHDLPAITSSTAGMRVAGDAQPVVAFGGVDSAPSGAGTLTKPVRFDNNGFETVTVKVASYTPASGYSGGSPSASTVVSPDSTSGAYLELPLGTYTFCYEWQLDQDVNNDDYFDYHHRITSAKTIGENASDDPNNAVTITLSPDSSVSNPNGKCGQAATESNGDLTPEEAANTGSHTYLMTCPADSWCAGESILVPLDISFSNNTVTVVDKDMEGEITVLTRTSPNQYRWNNPDGETRVLTFDSQGFSYQLDLDDSTYYYTRQDDNPAPSSSGAPSSSSSSASGSSSPESANTGTHTYSYYSTEFPDDEIYVSFTVTFSSGAAVIQDTNGLYWIFGENEAYLQEISENFYSYAPSNNGQWGTITFTNEGFIETWTDSGHTTYWTLQD